MKVHLSPMGSEGHAARFKQQEVSKCKDGAESNTYIRLEGSITSVEDDGPDQLCVEKLIVKSFTDISTVDFVGELITHCKTHITLIVQLLRVKRLRVVVLAVGHAGVKQVYQKK